MKLLRFGPPGQERPGLLDAAGVIRDLGAVIGDLDPSTLTLDGLAALRALDPASLPAAPADARLGPCVAKPGKFVCIGLNYADHAAESGLPIPEEPVVFMKATSALSGPNDPIIKPRGSTQLDWEVELAFVVGAHVSYASEEEAARAIAGYCVCNDVSERAFQMQSSQWDKGKGCDSFGPLGPWLVTPDEIPDAHDLSMWLEVNGKRFQDGSTKTMIFRPAFVLSYLSRFMSLQPGDVVTTGTPPGVGLGQKPQVWLNVGDRVALGIQGLGEQRQVVVGA
ncbi:MULTISPECIES: fumarylacetoacetate hydrolase family protein [unclassified Caulobacter]|uniref:fumarylacetoacetate hydrolase family protein n=1 Tax=unclassified Caulobacter TaxID=2648921 RepID=UPI0006F295CD|nr:MULTISPECIES: fumarylacetoacetate hydrolase family protein [unclassified Caulobacter]KQV54912.1 2-hydroxyhepta-2,4-diene-1,7-dioate isomerase [Caulobacter sp. Root342]KQV68482.1 2-hydroxyhepta-2,4-diene-1,7-dioate isomerase [Caulobacter sp. Root343]